MVGVKVSVAVGVAVSGSGGRGVTVRVAGGLSVGDGVTGGVEGLRAEYSKNANKMTRAPTITAEYLATGGGNLLSSFSVLDMAMSG